MNGADQKITHAANEDHGRNSPKQQYRHDTLLCFCPAKETPTYCQLFPTGFGDVFDPALGITRMADYRAYVVGDDGHFVSFEGFACRDDDKAITTAERLVDGHDVELWSGERFVIRLSEQPE
jgi:hypothetical protein